jgi:hypothetical protein
MKTFKNAFGLFGILCWAASVSMAQFPALSPYLQFQHFDFESHFEANGVIVVYGPLYKTALRLDAENVFSGDSSVVGFVLGAHGPYNCNDTGSYTVPPDTTHYTCQRHRAYTVQRFRGHKVEVNADTSKLTGVLLRGPIWTSFAYRYKNLVLHTHTDGHGNDWESPATWCSDTTDNCIDPVTIVRDSAGYLHWEHVPTVDSALNIYEINLASDPTGRAQIKPGEWVKIQCYLDNDSANGFAAVWVTNPRGTFLHATAHVHNRNGTLAQFHAGLYASSAVTGGGVWNDHLIIAHVLSLAYAILRYFPMGWE